jgi:hypothetical protein
MANGTTQFARIAYLCAIRVGEQYAPAADDRAASRLDDPAADSTFVGAAGAGVVRT